MFIDEKIAGTIYLSDDDTSLIVERQNFSK